MEKLKKETNSKMNKERYLEIYDLVVKHINYEIKRTDDSSKNRTVDIAKYLHSKDPKNIETRERAYLNYKVCEGKKVILTQIKEDIRLILLATINDDFKEE